MKLVLHIDGGSRGNPGPAAVGIVIELADRHTVIHEAGYVLGRATNNVAEYKGLICALRIVKKLGGADITVYSDSQLMVRQITGQYKVKSANLHAHFDKARRLLDQFSQWRLIHVLRQYNRRADELVNLALDAQKDVIELTAEGFVKASNGPSPAQHIAALRYAVQVEGDPGRNCPAHCPAESRFLVEAVMPAEFCTYAAKAILDVVDLDNPRSPPPPSAWATCSHCGVRLRIEAG